MFEDEIPVGKAEDLRGKTYNRLTVLYRVKNNGKKVKWKCQCECGNTTIVERMNLTSGHTKSCGCYKTDIVRKNLVGQRFGKLTVVKATDERDYNREIIWECLCDCGNITYVSVGNLRKEGGTKSCGCIKSTGETIIGILLRSNNISYEQQKTFDSCRFESGGLGKFDFYVNNHYLIEYDGIQHFEAIDFFGGDDQLLTQQERDMYKNQWCKDNNIPLIRIPYTKLDTLCIEDLLLETTQFKVN